MGGGKAHPFVAVQKGAMIDERPKQRGRLFTHIVVVTHLGTENGGLQSALIAQTVHADVFLNLVTADGDHFSHQAYRLGHYLVPAACKREPFVCSALQQIHRRRHIMHAEILCQCRILPHHGLIHRIGHVAVGNVSGRGGA